MAYDDGYFERLARAVEDSTSVGLPIHNNSKETTTNWKKVYQKMLEHYPDLTLTSEGLRSQYRRRQDGALRQNDKKRHDAAAGRDSLELR